MPAEQRPILAPDFYTFYARDLETLPSEELFGYVAAIREITESTAWTRLEGLWRQQEEREIKQLVQLKHDFHDYAARTGRLHGLRQARAVFESVLHAGKVVEERLAEAERRKERNDT